MALSHYRYVFLITYARSGSTLLMSLLNHCEGVCIRGENRATLLHLFRAQAALNDTAARGRNGRQQARDRPWFGAGSVRPAQFRRQLLNSYVAQVLVPPAGTRITGCKEIRHDHPFVDDAEFAAYVQFLIKSFPQARLVFNSRRVEDVCQSAWLRQRPRAKVAAMVATCERRFATALATHPAHCFHVDYDCFTADPQRYEALFAFLDLPYDPTRVAQVLAKPLAHQPQR